MMNGNCIAQTIIAAGLRHQLTPSTPAAGRQGRTVVTAFDLGALMGESTLVPAGQYEGMKAIIIAFRNVVDTFNL